MGKQPVRMKAVVYALSPFQQKVMTGLWKDLPGKIHHKVSENWHSALLLLSPLAGTYVYLLSLFFFLIFNAIYIFRVLVFWFIYKKKKKKMYIYLLWKLGGGIF